MEKEEHRTTNEKFNIDVKKKTAGTWFKKNMSLFVIVGAAGLFIFKEGMDFSRTEDDIITVISGMALTYLFTLYISISLLSLGKKSGKESKTYKDSLTYLGSAKENIKKIMYLLPRYCKHKNKEALEEVKGLLLENVGLSYDLYLKGYYKQEKIAKDLEPEEIDMLKQIQNIKITKLVPSELLSEHSKSKNKPYDPLYLGQDEQTNAKKSGMNMLWSKAMFPIVTGYLAVEVALGQNLWWGAIQVGIILLIGITHYMQGEDYVTNELRNRHINKADLLVDFLTLYENDKKIFDVELSLSTDAALDKANNQTDTPLTLNFDGKIDLEAVKTALGAKLVLGI